MKNLTPEQRLIVAFDFKPDLSQGHGRKWVKNQVLRLAEQLEGSGVIIKINSILRACGYDLIDHIHNLGLRVFADLKLYDIGNTLKTDGALLLEARPDFLTVVITAGPDSIRALKTELPGTELLGVSALTNLSDANTQEMYGGRSVKKTIEFFAKIGLEAGIDGFISSGKEASTLREKFGQEPSINAPAIRPLCLLVESDDQNPDRIMTPAKAIAAGADRIVVGRPITQAKSPFDAVSRTIEEIAAATK